jgi:opacity protein-like surface antigen
VAQTHPPGPAGAPQTHELQWSRIGGLSATKTPADISDSALRAFTAKSIPPPPIKRALYIKRNWQFGILAAPDFASVNSLAGDKPGSTIGITVDYQFAPRWYIGSGLLLDRRNYAARGEDFHPSHSFYQSNGVDSNHLDFVKGSLRMLEIPLNLRYDFSVTGSTLFFASAGVSSYLLSSENGNCYVQWLNGVVPKGFKYPASGDYLFSSMNLSLGVETGLSNSLSMLIAPYLKMPLRTIGHGQLQMNSVGISFSLKWAPVTSRRRR